MNHPSFTSYQILPASTADFLPIAELDREIWKDVPHGEVIPDGEHVWRIWCEHALVYVARAEEGALAGAIVAFPGMRGILCVHKVMVAEAHRGKGVGSLLFSVLLKEIDRQNSRCFLTVSPGNQAAVTLYRKWGFTHEQFVPGYYRETEHRLVLTRPSPNSPDL